MVSIESAFISKAKPPISLSGTTMKRTFSLIAHIFISVLILTSMGVSSSAQGSELAEKYKTRGNMYYGQRKYTQAITEFTKAITEDPDYLPAYYNRGLAYYDIHLYYKAIVDFDMVITMNPEDKDAYLSRGLCYSKVNKLKLALIDINKAAELGDPDAIRLLKNGDITKRIELARSKQRRINSIMDENQNKYHRVSEVADAGNEFGGNTIINTYSKGDPLYDGKEGIFKRIDYYDSTDTLKKTEYFHTAQFISDNDRNKTTLWYDDHLRITKKEFAYTGKMLNLTGVQYFDDQGILKKEVILDKHGNEISHKQLP